MGVPLPPTLVPSLSQLMAAGPIASRGWGGVGGTVLLCLVAPRWRGPWEAAGACWKLGSPGPWGSLLGQWRDGWGWRKGEGDGPWCQEGRGGRGAGCVQGANAAGVAL